MRRLLAAGMVIGMVAGLAQPAWAARTRMHDLAESPVYKEKMGGMIGRGLLNIVTSPVDLLVNTVNETKAGPPVIGTLTGLGKGIGCGVFRLGSGAVDVVTFWVPGFNGFPVSDSYEDCLRGIGGAASYNEPLAPPAAVIIESESELVAEPPKAAKRLWKK